MITLLERSIANNYYIKLNMSETLDQVNTKRLSQYDVSSIVITESMLSSTTHLNVKFIDHNGSLLTTAPLLPSNVFDVYYGKTEETAKVSKFRYSTVKMEPLSGMKQEEFFINSDMILVDWKKMFVNNYSRSWNDKKYSEVVTDILSEFDFEKVEVEETKRLSNVIQPQWNNATMLKWLARNAVNMSETGGYVYYMTLDNEFYFKTIENIIHNTKPKKIEHYTFVNDDTGFNYSKITNDYFTINNEGGLGTNHTHFNYNTKQFVSDTVTVEDLLQHQLTDNTMYHVDDVSPTYNVFGGRDTNTGKVVSNYMTNVLNSSSKIEISLNGRNDIKIGDKIDLIIPVSRQMITFSESIINEQYSGYWIVWKISHIFDLKTNKYITKAYMFRDGVNNLDTKDFLTTSTGKNNYK